MSDDAETLASDLLRGADAIGEFLGVSPRRAFDLLDSGSIPAGNEGKVWVASKSALREHYRRLVSGTGSVDQRHSPN